MTFSDHYFKTNICGKHVPSLIAVVNVVAQNLFGHTTRAWCNSNLRSYKLFMQELYTEGGRAMLHSEAQLHASFPTDLRTAQNSLNLDGDITIHATCPKCRCVYPPTMNGSMHKWPSECTWHPFPHTPHCGTQLVKLGVQNGYSVRVPILPYATQDFDSFVGRILSRPGYEEILDQGTVLSSDLEQLVDIKDGAAIRELKGPDGKPFLDRLKRGELRLVWSMSVDWLNPYHNKQAGKKASCGCIAMLLLLLPPSLRYRPENIYLHSVMPVEPSLAECNFFLSPLTESLRRNYIHGVHFSRTHRNPELGRDSRSMVAVHVFDLPGAKKVINHASYNSSRNFCSFCNLSKSEISNFDWRTWRLRHVDDLRAAAIAWRDAPNKAERQRIYQEHGVRWSVLWELPYFDPTRSVVVDGMHNLFQGLVQYHIREVLGIDLPEASEGVADPHKLEQARVILDTIPSRSSLERLTVPILKVLCLEKGLRPPVSVQGRRAKKAAYVDVLEEFLVRLFMSSNFTSLISPQRPRTSNGTPSHTQNRAATDFVLDIVGEELISETVSSEPEYRWTVGDDAVNQNELKSIHTYISQTIRPTWHTPPPSNLGEASHGKLKADQWRSAIEFDIPAAIAQIWQSNGRDMETEKLQRRKKLIDATFLLATAISWATSYITSVTHAVQYMTCMTAYLNVLKELYPNLAWRPNHHAALHIGHFLLLFGPMHGWWMFPFERLIGRLQKININCKRGMCASLSRAVIADGLSGELERTMLETLCASTNLKSLLLQHYETPALHKLSLLVDRAVTDRFRDPLAGVISPTSQGEMSGTPKRQRKPPHLSTGALRAFSDYYQESLGRSLPIPVLTSISTHSIDGLSFSVLRELEHNSTIFFRSQHQGQCPAVIQFIITIPTDKQLDVFFIVKRYAPLRRPVAEDPDPFTLYPAFGASLWSSRILPDLVVISSQQVVCHAIRRRWVNGIILFKILNRVSLYFLAIFISDDSYFIQKLVINPEIPQ